MVASFARFSDNLYVFQPRWLRWQLKLVVWPIFGKNHQNLVARPILGRYTKICSRWQWKLVAWPKFGRNDNWNWSRDQYLVINTKIWWQWQLKLVGWPIFGKITKTWSRWQLKLVAWPIFGKNYQNLVVLTIEIGHLTNFW